METLAETQPVPMSALAPLRHADCVEQCPLSGVTRKTFAHTEFSLTRTGQTNHPSLTYQYCYCLPVPTATCPLARLLSLGPRRCARAGQGKSRFYSAPRCEIWRR